MKTIKIIVILMMSLSAFSQDQVSKYDLRFGIGTSLLGSGDMQTIMFENELNIKLNKYFTISEGLGYGRSDYGVHLTSSFIQFNSNIYVSPFKNTKINDFRLGTGISLFKQSDVYIESAEYQNGVLVDQDHKFTKTNSVGINAIIEHTYRLNEKFSLGAKLFTQMYRNEDINSGILAKLVVNL